ncbi:hypothetical protein C8Q73DRAFT_97288 [Cubamyces lactineus]|nr:hypothetical protein C8Q73DRAFT_97288 [Cubamyces lactineus]
MPRRDGAPCSSRASFVCTWAILGPKEGSAGPLAPRATPCVVPLTLSLGTCSVHTPLPLEQRAAAEQCTGVRMCFSSQPSRPRNKKVQCFKTNSRALTFLPSAMSPMVYTILPVSIYRTKYFHTSSSCALDLCRLFSELSVAIYRCPCFLNTELLPQALNGRNSIANTPELGKENGGCIPATLCCLRPLFQRFLVRQTGLLVGPAAESLEAMRYI